MLFPCPVLADPAHQWMSEGICMVFIAPVETRKVFLNDNI